MGERLVELEYKPGEGVVLRIKSPRFGVIPESTRQRIIGVQKQMLLALRSSLDCAIEFVEKAEVQAEKTRTKIEVQ